MSLGLPIFVTSGFRFVWDVEFLPRWKRFAAPTETEMSTLSDQNARPLSDRFGDFLQSRGMRKTRQRELVLKVVVAQQGLFDAEQILAGLPPRGSRGHVSRPTVYRTLAEFLDAGLLRKFELDGRSLFAIDSGQQHTEHLYCTECHRFQEVHLTGLDAIREQAARSHLFQVQSHRLVIDGVCNECRQKRKRQRKRVDLI